MRVKARPPAQPRRQPASAVQPRGNPFIGGDWPGAMDRAEFGLDERLGDLALVEAQSRPAFI